MRTKEVLHRLRRHENELRQLGVERLFLFGPTARDEATARSDGVLFFDYPKGAFGLFELMEVKDRTSQILGLRTDNMTRDSLHRALREEVEATAIRMF